MSYALAVDVGTSYTAAAVVRFDEGASPLPECLPLGLRGSSVPSVVYYPEEGPVLVGEAAERRGLDSPGRVVREFKRRVGDDVPFALGTLTVRPEDVFATVARWVASRAAEREGEFPSAIFLTHPAAWGIHRLTAIRDALAAHGLDNVTLLPEPEAAALHYASQVRVEEGSTIAVYDLGGGTFDTAVLRKSGGSRFELLGRPDGIEDLGGADFDTAVFRYVAQHTGTALTDLDPADPTGMGALTRLRRECVEAKEALSADSEATIPVLLPGFQQQVRLVRTEFEALIEEPVRDTVDALEQSLARLHLEPADLSAVLLIGGSSRIPLVAQLVSEQLDRPIAVDADPKSSICLGAAVAAVLAHAAAAVDLAAASVPVASAAGVDATVVPVRAAPDVPGAPVRPSWSRKYATTAEAGVGADPLRRTRGGRGAHAPKPTVRVTAVAAAAAVLTILTATAAQSPDGLGSLTAMFVPQAGADTGASGPVGTPGPPGTESAGAGGATAAVNPQPLTGIEASAKRPLEAQAGLDISASPSSRQSALASAAAAAAGGAAAGGAPAGTVTAGTGVVPESMTLAPAPPPDTTQPASTSPGTGTTTPSGTATPSDTASPSSTTAPTPLSGSTSPTDPATSAAPTPTPLSTAVPTTTGASDPATDPIASPTSVDLTPVPATAPSPTPEETNPTPTPTDAAVATAPMTSPAA